MPLPSNVTDWVDAKYKRPRVDPEWLIDCYAWLTTEGGHSQGTGLQALLEAVEHQILESNLSDSMLPGTGLPTHIAVPSTTTTLTGFQVLVEITSITEIGSSAFNLNQTRMAREERAKAGNIGHEEGEGDVDVEGEGPMPKYSRGMLKLQLSDGTITLPAIEYRPLPDLSLENTPLGYKMLLKEVPVRRGVAFLEPKCVVLLGHKSDDREEQRQADFKKGLYSRMGLPEPEGEPAGAAPEAIPLPAPILGNLTQRAQPPLSLRSPLRDISPPPSPPFMPQVNDDEDLEPRRRRVPNAIPDLTPTSASSTLVSGPSTAVASTSSYFLSSGDSMLGSNTSTASAGLTSRLGAPGIDLVLSPTNRQTQKAIFAASPSPSPEHVWSSNGSTDDKEKGVAATFRAPLSGGERSKFDTAVKYINHSKNKETDQRNTAWKARGEGRDEETSYNRMSSDDFGDIDMELDPDILAGLDRLEREALGDGGRSHFTPVHLSSRVSSSSSARWKSQPSALEGAGASGNAGRAMEVIVVEDGDVDDDDGDDKENLPVPTRHVRRRTENSGSGDTMAMRDTERPTILAKYPSDVIVLSDSD